MKSGVLFLLILIAISSNSYSQSDKKELSKTYGNNASKGHYIQQRNISLYYEMYGKGKPLLLLHGNGGSIQDFANQIPYFSKLYRVIAVDSRAQGKSLDTQDSLSYEMMADDFNALLDSLHLDSCYVMGWSDGGIVGLLLAIRHPEKVEKLVISGANAWPDTSAVDTWAYEQTIRDIDSLSKLTSTTEVKNKLKLTKLLLHEPHISLKQLNSIYCPTLVVGGDHDVILPKHTTTIAEAIPNSQLWILPNAGHAPLIRYAKLFNETTKVFFQTPFRPITREGRFY